MKYQEYSESETLYEIGEVLRYPIDRKARFKMD